MDNRIAKHLAQANVARMRAPIDDPAMQGFVDRLDPLNDLADSTPGFVWRYQTEAGNATEVRVFNDELILFNMSVWESLGALRDYVYRSNHIEAVQRRSKWFEKPTRPPFVLWWVDPGYIPTVEEAKERLETLWREGPTPEAFTFRKTFGE